MRPFVVVALAGLLVSTSAWAHAWVQRRHFDLPPDQALPRPSVILAHESIRFAGVAEDDVFLLAPRIEWSGKGLNDLWAVGNDVVVTGSIRDHARLFGRTVRVEGHIANGLFVLGTTVTLATTASVHGGAIIRAEDVLLNGVVEGPLNITAERVTLGGVIRGDVRIRAADLRAFPGTRIEGDLVYQSPAEFLPDPRVTITGELARAAPEARPSRNLTFPAFLYLGALLVGVPFLLLFPDFAGRAVRLWRHSFWPSLAIGAIAVGLIPLMTALALATVVGIPLAAVLGGAALVFLYVSQFVGALAIGAGLLRRRGLMGVRDAVLTLVVGLAVLYVLPLIPTLGLPLLLAALVVGFGAFLRALLTPERPQRGGQGADGAESRAREVIAIHEGEPPYAHR